MERLSRFAGYNEDSDREANSILSVMRSQSAFISDPAIRASMSASDFKITDLRSGSDFTLFLTVPGEYLHICDKWSRITNGCFMRDLMKAPAGNRVTFVLDEFPSLGASALFPTAIALSAGYGIRLWPCLQDLNQLKRLYPDEWETFLANAGAQIFLAPRDLTTAEYISRRCGQTTVSVKNLSTREISVQEASRGFKGLTQSESPHARPLFFPQEVMAIRGDLSMLFLPDVDNVVIAGRTPYWSIPELAGRYDTNPYHT
jgi:type IV secretion system protein VirD4